MKQFRYIQTDFVGNCILYLQQSSARRSRASPKGAKTTAIIWYWNVNLYNTQVISGHISAFVMWFNSSYFHCHVMVQISMNYKCPTTIFVKKKKYQAWKTLTKIKHYRIDFAPHNIQVHGIHIWYQMSQNFPHLQCHFTWGSWSSGKQDTPSWEDEHTLQASVTCCLQQHISSLWHSSKWPP